MRVVQTFWTGNSPQPSIAHFGWLKPEYHLMSWVLSVNLLRKHYDQLVLYTDRQGEDLLIRKLKLPYTDVKVDMEVMNQYHPDLWALSKIHTYASQTEPFLHVDGDVFTWKPFPEDLLKSDLIAQNLEMGGAYYRDILDGLKSNLTYFPEAVQKDKSEEVYSYNAGIIGGCDFEFYKRYAREAFAFVDQNQHMMDQVNKLNFNIFFEQYLFYCMLSDEQREVNCLFPDPFADPFYAGFANFNEVPGLRTYLHPLGRYKKNEPILRMMENQLRHDFPEAYVQLLEFFEAEPGLVAPSLATKGLMQQLSNEDLPALAGVDDISTKALLSRDITAYSTLQLFTQEGLEQHQFDSFVLDSRVTLADATGIGPVEVAASEHIEAPPACLALVPEAGGSNTEVNLDELDLEIVEFVKGKPQQVSQLLYHLVQYFEDETEANMSTGFRELVSNRLINLMMNRVIQYVPNNQSFNLNHTNLGKISYSIPE